MARKSQQRQRAAKAAADREARHRQERRKRWLGVGIGTLAVAGVIALLVAVWPDEGADLEGADFSQDSWNLPALEGEGRVAIAEYRGKPTVAAFFAEWCEVCAREIPILAAFSDEVGDAINFVGIDMMDGGRGLDKAEEWGVASRWPLARDVGNGNGSMLSSGTFGARGSPLNVLYDPAGNIVLIRNGGISPQEILQAFAPFLEG
jgi:thiol-disulfide isomerase/thioredoxin